MGKAVVDPGQPFNDEQVETIESNRMNLYQHVVGCLDGRLWQLLYPQVLQSAHGYQSQGFHSWVLKRWIQDLLARLERNRDRRAARSSGLKEETEVDPTLGGIPDTAHHVGQPVPLARHCQR